MAYLYVGLSVNFASSVTRLGNFWKILHSNFLSKVAQIFSDFWDLIENVTSNVKFDVATFRQLFKNWASFYFNI